MFKNHDERLKDIIKALKERMEKCKGKKGILPDIDEMEKSYGVDLSASEINALKICMDLELRPSDIEMLKIQLLWGTYGKSGKEKFKSKSLCDCDTEHLENIMIMTPPSSSLTRKIIIEILKDRYSGKQKDPTLD